MKELQSLIAKQWIIKADDPELYYKIKDQLKILRNFVQEKLGYQIIVSPLMIKLEKLPAKAEPWMGIQEFQSIKEYQMLCFVLMFLEDKENEQQFVLSEITEFILVQFQDESIDWTKFTTRKQLIRVLKFCVDMGMLVVNDGDGELFSKDVEIEVLYENTGISRYFLRNFFSDVLRLNQPRDFHDSTWFDVDETSGIVRRQRVYRRLLLSPGVYRENDALEDFAYLRNKRNQIERDFQSFLPCEIHLHKSSAYLVLEDYKKSSYFPKTQAKDEVLLCICKAIQEYAGEQVLAEHEILSLSFKDFEHLVFQCITRIIKALPKTYRDKTVSLLSNEAIEHLINYGFVVVENEIVKIQPIVAKIGGSYEGVDDNE
ncbi:uncharacterized protein (TIGR02678 family) [Breznakia blatticola]|uniref:Uncharacterized protein (TIGR02678 family) n=1 Tax=Breznakia blatticola TaxID=1754012 RepID=A0A4R7ZFV1_9FIRM|nr:TIGR02678 family protein [Breznakia blatticola]TDW16533.1 uncharacterized protein (TIGR02678 family) [Breznakia blatticola]